MLEQMIRCLRTIRNFITFLMAWLIMIIGQKINLNTKNKRLVRQKNHWNEGNIEDNFNALFEKFEDSIIVVSYGEPGSPSIYKIKKLLLKYKSKVRIAKRNINTS